MTTKETQHSKETLKQNKNNFKKLEETLDPVQE